MSSDEEELDPNVLPFKQVGIASFKRESLLQGKITLFSPHKNGVAKVQLRDEQGDELWILFRGQWAEEAIKQFAALGSKVCLRAEYGMVEEMKTKKGKPQLDEKGRQVYQVVFDNGVKGFWGWNKRGKKFTYQNDSTSARSTQQRYSVDSTNPHSRPSSKSTSKDQRAIARLANRTGNPTLDEQILAVPEGNPDNPYRGEAAPHYAEETGSDVSDDSGGKEESDDEEEEQPTKKKQKRVRREDRREWGLKSDKSKLEYTPLSTFSGGFKNKPGMNVIAIAVLKREIFKTPNDYSTEIWLYDPTQISTPIRLNFFGPAEDKLPVFKNGDVLIMQQLNWSKDKHWLVAYGQPTKGKFLVIPSEKAQTYQPGSNLVKNLPQCAQRLAKFSEDELIYARDLSLWSKRFDVVGNHVDPGIGMDKGPVDAKEVSKQVSKGGGGGRKQITISQVEPTVFADVQGEIVKFYNPHNTSSIPDNEAVQLFITDYTRNEQLISYEDLSQIRLPGPYTLQISIYGHQAKPLVEFSRNPEEDLKTKFIHCRNIRPKLTEKGLLEATMFIDEKRPDKSDVTIFKTSERLKDTPWYKEFDGRRKRYLNSSMSDKIHKPHLTMNDEEVKEATTYDDPFATPFHTLQLELSPLSNVVKTTASFVGTFLTSARVIDYKPDKIEDFVVAYCPSCQEPLSKGLMKCFEHDQVAYMFQFALLLSDDSLPPNHSSSPRLLLEFSGRHADTLFPGIPPSSAYFDPSTASSSLASLRRRLEPLLGNLPNLKRELEEKGELSGEGVKEEDLGKMMKYVVESWVDEEQGGKIRWRCNRRRTLFYDPSEGSLNA
ncbi:hypothetical protein JCM5353_006212 [Sporobolomyces roseus]